MLAVRVIDLSGVEVYREFTSRAAELRVSDLRKRLCRKLDLPETLAIFFREPETETETLSLNDDDLNDSWNRSESNLSSFPNFLDENEADRDDVYAVLHDDDLVFPQPDAIGTSDLNFNQTNLQADSTKEIQTTNSMNNDLNYSESQPGAKSVTSEGQIYKSPSDSDTYLSSNQIHTQNGIPLTQVTAVASATVLPAQDSSGQQNMSNQYTTLSQQSRSRNLLRHKDLVSMAQRSSITVVSMSSQGDVNSMKVNKSFSIGRTTSTPKAQSSQKNSNLIGGATKVQQVRTQTESINDTCKSETNSVTTGNTNTNTPTITSQVNDETGNNDTQNLQSRSVTSPDVNLPTSQKQQHNPQQFQKSKSYKLKEPTYNQQTIVTIRLIVRTVDFSLFTDPKNMGYEERVWQALNNQGLDACREFVYQEEWQKFNFSLPKLLRLLASSTGYDRLLEAFVENETRTTTTALLVIPSKKYPDNLQCLKWFEKNRSRQLDQQEQQIQNSAEKMRAQSFSPGPEQIDKCLLPLSINQNQSQTTVDLNNIYDYTSSQYQLDNNDHGSKTSVTQQYYHHYGGPGQLNQEDSWAQSSSASSSDGELVQTDQQQVSPIISTNLKLTKKLSDNALNVLGVGVGVDRADRGDGTDNCSSSSSATDCNDSSRNINDGNAVRETKRERNMKQMASLKSLTTVLNSDNHRILVDPAQYERDAYSLQALKAYEKSLKNSKQDKSLTTLTQTGDRATAEKNTVTTQSHSSSTNHNDNLDRDKEKVNESQNLNLNAIDNCNNSCNNPDLIGPGSVKSLVIQNDVNENAIYFDQKVTGKQAQPVSNFQQSEMVSLGVKNDSVTTNNNIESASIAIIGNCVERPVSANSNQSVGQNGPDTVTAQYQTQSQSQSYNNTQQPIQNYQYGSRKNSKTKSSQRGGPLSSSRN